MILENGGEEGALNLGEAGLCLIPQLSSLENAQRSLSFTLYL